MKNNTHNEKLIATVILMAKELSKDLERDKHPLYDVPAVMANVLRTMLDDPDSVLEQVATAANLHS